jgi:hypothetical protein
MQSTSEEESDYYRIVQLAQENGRRQKRRKGTIQNPFCTSLRMRTNYVGHIVK